MNRTIRLCTLLLAVTLGATASGQQPPAPQAVPGASRYRVVLNVVAGGDPAVVARQLSAVARATVESRDGTGFVIAAPETGIRLLAGHPMVAGIERLDASATSVAPEWKRTYAYDGSGNIKSIAGTYTDRYTYDVFGRLTGAGTEGRPSAYSYDRFGNLLTMTLDGSTVRLGANAGTNKLTNTTTPSGAAAYHGTYDAAGRMTGLADGSTFTYDGLGMMTSSSGTPDGKRKVYAYTAGNERIASIAVSGNTEQHSEWTFRDPSGKVLRRVERSGAGGPWVWRQDYIYAGNRLLASEIDTAPRTLHYFPDHLGTSRLVTGNGGVKVGEPAYFPFGSEAATVASQSAQAYGGYDRLKFTGHERDSSQLDYMHARYYGAGLGRFLSVDPTWDSAQLRAPQTWNRYTYALNNPLRYTDPDGKVAIADDVAVGLVVGTLMLTAYMQAPSSTMPGRNNGEALAQSAAGTIAAIGSAIGTVAISLEQERKSQSVIIGESMERVKDGAVQTGAVPLAFPEEGNKTAQSVQALKAALASGARVLDVGYDPDRALRPSMPYIAERRLLYGSGRTPRHHSIKIIQGEVTQLWEWVSGGVAR